ncbi:RDD family protein [Tenacibaculum caenipelagi]|uniref:Putative RDD family membrane protein YckC n=1 Tax=Tenacibaculum caenipelagi TaxID=1325435 RepID=A0A4R6TER5_9FLAO|nr:RDD family protein [Tenacibaculum caenipelagi]TDQ28697.1 putative RDD family membrane protein YckC [Tenacibaculum caenipelagi]
MDKVEHKGLLYEEISKFSYSNPRVRRILSMLLDHFIICLSIVPLVIIISEVVSQFEHDSNKLIGNDLFFILMFICTNKDFLKGKSPAKRIMGYQIIDIKTNKPASEFQCFVRNLTIIGWPIEVIVGLINPQRRLGDFLANTKVITSDKEKLKSMWNDLKNIKMKINFIGILMLGGLFFYGLNKLL